MSHFLSMLAGAKSFGSHPTSGFASWRYASAMNFFPLAESIACRTYSFPSLLYLYTVITIEYFFNEKTQLVKTGWVSRIYDSAKSQPFGPNNCNLSTAFISYANIY